MLVAPRLDGRVVEALFQQRKVLEGLIQLFSQVRFGSSARVEGDTFHETIAIEDGAYYEGSIKRHVSNSHIPEELHKNNLVEKS